jgi:hypothetical protein
LWAIGMPGQQQTRQEGLGVPVHCESVC